MPSLLRQNLHKQRQQNLRNVKVQVTINKTKSATSIEYSRYHGMLKDWTRRWDAPLCLCTNSIQSPVSSRGVRRWSFMRRETRVAFCLKLGSDKTREIDVYSSSSVTVFISTKDPCPLVWSARHFQVDHSTKGSQQQVHHGRQPHKCCCDQREEGTTLFWRVQGYRSVESSRQSWC